MKLAPSLTMGNRIVALKIDLIPVQCTVVNSCQFLSNLQSKTKSQDTLAKFSKVLKTIFEAFICRLVEPKEQNGSNQE